MPRPLSRLCLAAAFLLPTAAIASPLDGWFRTPHKSAYTSTYRGGCDIVVKRPGGNPTQDMTGSIGHAKSYQSNGGRRNPTVCH